MVVLPPDAGVDDAGTPDAGDSDGGAADAGDVDGGSPPAVHHDYAVGCDCQAGPGGVALALAPLALGGLRARRRG